LHRDAVSFAIGNFGDEEIVIDRRFGKQDFAALLHGSLKHIVDVFHAEIDDCSVFRRNIGLSLGKRAACPILAFLEGEIGHPVVMDRDDFRKANVKNGAVETHRPFNIKHGNFDMGNQVHAVAPSGICLTCIGDLCTGYDIDAVNGQLQPRPPGRRAAIPYDAADPVGFYAALLLRSI